ncbi:hypothetical protein HMPREF1981_00040 [Bacteroides pyogenes F0041]|uniref:Uncharacterized protein n=1 Tax=Bacteroides pyogenes F0041 TaxID=1321819 RepID=U2CXH7_9BACE|nr:hypothetical protein HMPREF1981_00040 [Bacteroides pyogenes F0041]
MIFFNAVAKVELFMELCKILWQKNVGPFSLRGMGYDVSIVMMGQVLCSV